MRRAAGIGAVMAMSLGVGGCGEDAPVRQPYLVTVEATGNVDLYQRPNAIHEPKAGTLRLGQKAIAYCYFESATLGMDSIGLVNLNVEGYAFVAKRDTDSNVLTENFDHTIEELQELESCQTLANPDVEFPKG
jgi:hypothetical protein